MPSAILRGATGQPGPGAYSTGLTTGIFNDLNFVIPDYIPGLIAKYGNSSYMLAAEILGNTNIESVNTTTNTYSHFEKGRIYGSGLVATTVTSTGANNTVNVTLKSPQSYVTITGATGTVTPFLLYQTVKIRSNGQKATITNITPTTGAFVLTLKPLGTGVNLCTGNNTGAIQAGEGIETYGNQLAGESSDSQGTQQPNLYRYDNTATVLRASVKASDLSGMNRTQIDFGDGSFYLPTLAVKTMNLQMMMNIEDAVLEGVPYGNIVAGDTSGDVSSPIGTTGILVDVENRGSEIDYVTNQFAVGDFQNLTNTLDSNGGPREYHFLQDLHQRQDINNLLFGIYKNGAIKYDSVGFSQEAAVTYGFKGFSTDTFDFHFHRYKGFTANAVFGYVPTQGDYRANFGFAVPQGMTQDARTDESRPYMQWVYQQNPDIPTSQRIYSWDLGYTKNTKTTQASNKYEQICYVGSRTTAAEQFALLMGLVS